MSNLLAMSYGTKNSSFLKPIVTLELFQQEPFLQFAPNAKGTQKCNSYGFSPAQVPQETRTILQVLHLPKAIKSYRNL